MFAEIDADVYVLADGDDTYDVGAAPELIRQLRTQCLDMVVGRRVEPADSAHVYPPGHRFGNRLLTGIVQRLFGATCEDMLSGYRVFSRRYVKSFPAFSRGFETETEMTVHALDLSMPFAEVATEYRERPDGVDQQAPHDPRRHPHRPVHPAALEGVRAAAVLRDSSRS